MQEIVTGSFAPARWRFWPLQTIRVVDWNIEHGLKLTAIIDFLAAQNADLVVLQEADLNARRTHCVNVAEEIARKLEMQYVFGREFQELAEGSPASPAYIGQATLCRWPLENPRLIRFRQQSGFWHPRWYLPNMPLFQERLGGRVALVTEMRVAGRSLLVYNLHLESRGSDDLRLSQLEEVLADAAQFQSRMPVLVAGDLNVNTFIGDSAAVIEQAGFFDAVGLSSIPTTPRRHLFGAGRMIDRGLVRGQVRAAAGQVHTSVPASDHYPLSFRLEFL